MLPCGFKIRVITNTCIQLHVDMYLHTGTCKFRRLSFHNQSQTQGGAIPVASKASLYTPAKGRATDTEALPKSEGIKVKYRPHNVHAKVCRTHPQLLKLHLHAHRCSRWWTVKQIEGFGMSVSISAMSIVCISCELIHPWLDGYHWLDQFSKRGVKGVH